MSNRYCRTLHQLIGLLLFSLHAQAGTLVTDAGIIHVVSLCPEGYIECDYVSLTFADAANPSLLGSTLYSRCADGISPCRFLGYEFPKAHTTIRIYDQGDSVRIEETHNDSGHVISQQSTAWVDNDNALTRYCFAASTSLINTLPGRGDDHYGHWLIAQFDGLPCEQSTLTLSIVDPDTQKTLYSMGYAWNELTRHDDYRPKQYNDIATARLYALLNSVGQSIQWPEYQYSSTKDAPSMASRINWLEQQRAQTDTSTFDANPESPLASPAEQSYNALTNELDYLQQQGFEYAISREYYQQLKASGAALFLFEYGEGQSLAIALDISIGQIVTVSSEAL